MDIPSALPRAGELNHLLFAFVSASGRTRALPTTLHVGQPRVEVVDIPDSAAYDTALRTDLVERALSCLDCPAPFGWITRTGALIAGDRDHQWHVAVLSAAERLGLPDPDFYVITRYGWLDLRSGDLQEWHRVRPARRREAS